MFLSLRYISSGTLSALNEESDMTIAVSVFSDSIITDDGLESVMRKLHAEQDEIMGWKLERNGRKIHIVLGSQDIEFMPESILNEAEKLLGTPVKSRVSMFFNDEPEDKFEYRMARAVAKAMAEIWNVSFDDHAGHSERIYPPGAPVS